jgi:hypothetical protein
MSPLIANPVGQATTLVGTPVERPVVLDDLSSPQYLNELEHYYPGSGKQRIASGTQHFTLDETDTTAPVAVCAYCKHGSPFGPLTPWREIDEAMAEHRQKYCPAFEAARQA